MPDRWRGENSWTPTPRRSRWTPKTGRRSKGSEASGPSRPPPSRPAAGSPLSRRCLPGERSRLFTYREDDETFYVLEGAKFLLITTPSTNASTARPLETLLPHGAFHRIGSPIGRGSTPRRGSTTSRFSVPRPRPGPRGRDLEGDAAPPHRGDDSRWQPGPCATTSPTPSPGYGWRTGRGPSSAPVGPVWVTAKRRGVTAAAGLPLRPAFRR